MLNLFSGCASLFFYPEKQHFDNPALNQFIHEDIYFRTADGTLLHSWFFPAKEALGSVLFLHGNAENISTHVSSILWLVRSGFNVLAFDYRGYGLSEGKPSLQGVHNDAEAALETLLAMSVVDKDRIIVFGQSIGGAVAVNLVAATPHKDHIKALIVDSAFASYRSIAREKMNQFLLTWLFQYPLSWLFNDSYSPAKKIAAVSPVPVLIMHGTLDQVVPMHHGELLFQEAQQPKEFWPVTAVGHIQGVSVPSVRERLLLYLKERIKK
jgi:fermentation-respiration switch protein FrsA (DUF1100 family)